MFQGGFRDSGSPSSQRARRVSQVRWQAVFKHCTILYGTCQDSDDGVNFQSEYWRKLIPSDFASA